MIACVIHGARELKIENRPEPPHPQDGEVLVRFGAGGICGSDLHYYHEGGILDFKVREPLVLGHEVAGEVVEIGPGVTKVSVGNRVAVNPLRSCLRCVYCLSGRPNLCLNRRFFSERKHLTSREVERLIEATKGGRNEIRDRCLLLLMFRHGLRVSEACGMKLDQVDTESRVLHVARLKGGLATTQPLRSDELRAISAWLKERARMKP